MKTEDFLRYTWQLSAFETLSVGNWVVCAVGFFSDIEKNLFPYKRVSDHFLSKIKKYQKS